MEVMMLFDKRRASGPGGSSQDDIYGLRYMWSYFQGFKPFDDAQGRESFDFAQDRELVERRVERVLFFSRSVCILPGVLRSKPLKIRPLQALGGILFEISSFEEQP
jgi:hypothetical protein